MTTLASYAPLLPEIALAIGAMLLLMLGAFGGNDENAGNATTWLAILLLAGTALGVSLMPADTVRLFDGAFVLDGFGQFLKVLVLVGAAIALILTFDDFSRAKVLAFEYPVLVVLATLGMLVMISAGDLIALYLGLELQSLALYVIAAFKRDDVKSSEAGLKYFVLGALSSGMLLYGASLIYGVTGAISFATIAEVAAAPGAGQNIGLIVGLVFVLVGLAFKVSAVPFHMWTPDVYQGAPTPVTAFFASAPKIAAMALFLRVMHQAFPGIAAQWQQVVVFIAIASMLLGAFAAIGQNNIKRLLAYSSIGHIGFALVGLAANNAEGTSGILIYLTIYLVMTLGTFACVLAMRRGGEPVEDIDQLAGLAQTNLGMAAVLGVLMFSLAGIPPLAGFWAKWYVFLPAIKAGLYPLAVIGVLASVVGAYYYLRIVKIMFFDAPAAPFDPVEARSLGVMLASALLVIAFVLPQIGGPVVNGAEAAARTLNPGAVVQPAAPAPAPAAVTP